MARDFEAALRAAGKPVEAVYYEEGRHNGIFTSSTQYRDEVLRMLAFLSCAIYALDFHHGLLEAFKRVEGRNVSGTVAPSIEVPVQGRTSACRRRLTALARASLPLSAAPDAWR